MNNDAVPENPFSDVDRIDGVLEIVSAGSPQTTSVFVDGKPIKFIQSIRFIAGPEGCFVQLVAAAKLRLRGRIVGLQAADPPVVTQQPAATPPAAPAAPPTAPPPS